MDLLQVLNVNMKKLIEGKLLDISDERVSYSIGKCGKTSARFIHVTFFKLSCQCICVVRTVQGNRHHGMLLLASASLN